MNAQSNTILRVFILTLLIQTNIVAHAQHPFEWLEGVWKHPTKSIYEVWTKGESEILLNGISYRITSSGDTIVTEEIKFIREGNTYYYIPDVPGNQGPVSFKVTEFNHTGFTAENPTHDFPKKISYAYSIHENQFVATISGDGKSIDFPFQKDNKLKK